MKNDEAASANARPEEGDGELMDSVVWVFAGLENVDMSGQDEIALTDSFTLKKPDKVLLSCRDRYSMSGNDFRQIEDVSCFLLRRERGSSLRTPERDRHVSRLQDALLAFQAIKPLHVSGFTFQTIQFAPATLNLERVNKRPPTDPGRWAKMRAFDAPLLAQVPDMISRVRRVMEGNDGQKKNALYFFQFALEHFHPYVAALLAVAGMEAIFDSSDRNNFKQKLCDCVGSSALAFPDWNSPGIAPPQFTAEELAIHLYTLRSKIAHGVNLREAAQDKSAPVDLLKLVELIPDFEKPTYAMLLCESSIYLLAEVLKRVL